MVDNTNIADTASSNQEAGVSAEQPISKPTATLLGSISYENEEDWEKFLDNLTAEHSIIVLIAAANYSQSKGVFNLAESELIAKSLKRIKQKVIAQQESITNSDKTSPDKPTQ